MSLFEWKVILAALLIVGYLRYSTLWGDPGYRIAGVAAIGLSLYPATSLLPGILVWAWTLGFPLLLVFGLIPRALLAGRFRQARILASAFRHVSVSSHQRVMAMLVEASSWADEGHTATAVRIAERVRRAPAATAYLDGYIAVVLADLFVNAGRYRDAVAATDRLAVHGSPPTGTHLWAQRIQADLNVEEALVQLGESNVARFEEIRNDPKLPDVLRLWLGVHRTWVLARADRGSQALEAWEGIRPLASKMSPSYQSELHYSRAMALLALARYAEARDAIREGLSLAVRASSRRNGKFLLGVCAMRAGALEEAVQWFEEGVREPYKAQGGDELVCYGDALLRLGRRDEARQAYGLVLQRDPENAAAGTARLRLEELDRPILGRSDE